jgi:hypothetical protein
MQEARDRRPEAGSRREVATRQQTKTVFGMNVKVVVAIQIDFSLVVIIHLLNVKHSPVQSNMNINHLSANVWFLPLDDFHNPYMNHSSTRLMSLTMQMIARESILNRNSYLVQENFSFNNPFTCIHGFSFHFISFLSFSLSLFLSFSLSLFLSFTLSFIVLHFGEDCQLLYFEINLV